MLIGTSTAWLQQSHTITSSDIPLGGIFSRLACTGLSLSFYFSQFFLPISLMPIYPQWKVNPPALGQFLPWLVIGGVLTGLWSQRKSWGRHALLALGYFTVMLSPFLGFKVISYMGFTWVMDHFLYVPTIGLIGITVAALEPIDFRLTPATRPLFASLIAVAIALLMLESHTCAKIFLNQKILWTYALEHNPDAWPAHDNLGNVLFGEGHIAEAIDHYRIAVQLAPERVEAHNNLGVALTQIHQTEEALDHFNPPKPMTIWRNCKLKPGLTNRPWE